MMLSVLLLLVFLSVRLILLSEEPNAVGKSFAFVGLRATLILYSTFIPFLVFGLAIAFTIIGSKKMEDSRMVVGSFLLAFVALLKFYWPFVMILF